MHTATVQKVHNMHPYKVLAQIYTEHSHQAAQGGTDAGPERKNQKYALFYTSGFTKKVG